MLCMTQVKKKKREKFAVHNYVKNCGNCGITLYEDDRIVYMPAGVTESSWFHEDYHGCQDALDRINAQIKLHRRKQVKNYG
jgi:hypothetical protein